MKRIHGMLQIFFSRGNEKNGVLSLFFSFFLINTTCFSHIPSEVLDKFDLIM